MNLLSKILSRVPPKVRQFFSRKPVLEFRASCSREELIQRFRSRVKWRGFWGTGASGWVFRDGIHVGWATKLINDSFAPVFHGRIEADGTSSVLKGCMSHSRFAQVFMAIWCGANVLFSVVFVWTILVPLGGYAMLWILNGMMSIGDELHPGRDQKILDTIREACEMPASSEAKISAELSN